MYHGYGMMGYPVYSNSVWDGYHHYAYGSEEDPPNLILAGGTPWPYDFDIAHHRNGTGVFLPKLEHGTGVFHPTSELLVNPNRSDRVSNLWNPNRVDRVSNLANPNRVDRESNLANPNRVNREGNLANRNRLDREGNLVDPNRVDREGDLVSILALPSEVQELILTFLPLACIVGASCVCKKWKQIVHCGKFKMNNDGISSKKPWYFMFTNYDDHNGKIYDPEQGYWYDFKFPFNLKDTWKVAACSGLICFMQENDCDFEIYICNPITRKCIQFEEGFGAQQSSYSSLALSVDQASHAYTIAIVRTWEVQDSFSRWNTSIHIYNSVKRTWLPPFVETLSGWRAGNDSIVFDGVLYFVVTELGTTNCHALLSYNIKSSSSNGDLIKTLIPIPFSLTSVRLMQLQDKIVVVGGVGSHDIPENIGVWMLKGTWWEEVSSVPNSFIQGFEELDDVFASSGAGDLIYIQMYGAKSLLVFDMKSKVWKWCQKCPLSKKSDLQLFSGFCFEPRLDISP
ncbi:F-box/kelch-repeat protein [Heracleum sosnowskyi]|uniref:F-box/kelch-repeat protein n=1 Tax=Heracleum sosnowskyi TaxID=360622 RepID=A0AAD8I305_9APIA|nr:F-box/kelch-repeat protein [Heracleum sosnowskyi]